MLVYRLKLSLNVLSIWVSAHNSVPGSVTMFFNHNADTLLHIMGVRFTGSFSVPGHSVVLGNYILFILPQ